MSNSDLVLPLTIGPAFRTPCGLRLRNDLRVNPQLASSPISASLRACSCFCPYPLLLSARVANFHLSAPPLICSALLRPGGCVGRTTHSSSASIRFSPLRKPPMSLLITQGLCISGPFSPFCHQREPRPDRVSYSFELDECPLGFLGTLSFDPTGLPRFGRTGHG